MIDRVTPPVGEDWLRPLPTARVWRWRLRGGQVPVERTVEAAHAVFAALNDTAARLFGASTLPPDLHADVARSSVRGRQVHNHAFLLPEDVHGHGHIDHFAVMAPQALGGEGFSRKGLILLSACPGFWIGGVPDVSLHPLSMSPACPFGTDRPARQWMSVTPFVPPLAGGEPELQIVKTLAELGFPTPRFVEWVDDRTRPDGRSLTASAFTPRGAAARRWAKFAGREGRMAYWRILFDQPVEGPILIGGLSHFGLGRFAPAPDE